PAATADVSVTARTTVSSVRPLIRSRSGSTSTWYCMSRWPQMATFATPGIAIRRGRIVHLARIVSSICESFCDETPILSKRLEDDWRPRHNGEARALHGQPLLDHLPRRHEVGSLFEDQDHRRQTENRL